MVEFIQLMLMIKFDYRRTNIEKNLIFLSASFKTQKKIRKHIRKYSKFKRKKEISQPLRGKQGGALSKIQ